MRSTMLTGVTGFLGRHILWRRLQDGGPEDRVFCLIRAKSQDEANERLSTLLNDPLAGLSESQKVRASAIIGNICLPDLGILETARHRLAECLTDIVHCAASVKFNLNLNEARNINVKGTQSMLDLARMAVKTGTLRRFDYVGTAYVAGSREGVARENDLILTQKFHNTYEQTKAESELAVRDATGDLPITIFRPSIVVGDSRTGITQSFNVLYWPLKVFARGLVPVIPADPKGLVDLVPINYVTDAIEWIGSHLTPSGRCYHLAAGPEKSTSVHTVAQRTADFFGVRVPPYVSPRTFYTFIKPLFKLILWGPSRHVYKVGEQYIPFFAYRTSFDTSLTEEVLQGTGIAAPSITDYFDKLLQYCKASDWGKRDPQNWDPLASATP